MPRRTSAFLASAVEEADSVIRDESCCCAQAAETGQRGRFRNCGAQGLAKFRVQGPAQSPRLQEKRKDFSRNGASLERPRLMTGTVTTLCARNWQKPVWGLQGSSRSSSPLA